MIHSLQIKNFMGLPDLNVDDISAINLILGKNDTGKTNLLKLIFSNLKALESYSENPLDSFNQLKLFEDVLADKISACFLLSVGKLVTIGTQKSEVSFSLKNREGYAQTISYSIKKDSREVSTFVESNSQRNFPSNAVYIPANEVLSTFSMSTVQLAFNTNSDLLESLKVKSKKANTEQKFQKIVKKLEDLMEGKLENVGSDRIPTFFIKNKQKFSLQQISDGVKKLGTLAALINNQQIRQGTILFIDNPETFLHPQAIRKLVEILIDLSKAGVQIFLSTHNYVVLKQLAICSGKEKIASIVWSLTNESAHISKYDLIDGGLPNNLLIDENIAMYEEEIAIAFS